MNTVKNQDITSTNLCPEVVSPESTADHGSKLFQVNGETWSVKNADRRIYVLLGTMGVVDLSIVYGAMHAKEQYWPSWCKFLYEQEGKEKAALVLNLLNAAREGLKGDDALAFTYLLVSTLRHCTFWLKEHTARLP